MRTSGRSGSSPVVIDAKPAIATVPHMSRSLGSSSAVTAVEISSPPIFSGSQQRYVKAITSSSISSKDSVDYHGAQQFNKKDAHIHRASSIGHFNTMGSAITQTLRGNWHNEITGMGLGNSQSSAERPSSVKFEPFRKVHGILVRDNSVQTLESFINLDLSLASNTEKLCSKASVEDDANDTFLANLPPSIPDEDCQKIPRAPAPEPDAMLGLSLANMVPYIIGDKQVYATNDLDDKANVIMSYAFCGHPRPDSPTSTILRSRPDVIYRPTPRRFASNPSAPGTPFSERSVSGSSEDGSVSSYSTLPSSISSPDSSKLSVTKNSAFSQIRNLSAQAYPKRIQMHVESVVNRICS